MAKRLNSLVWYLRERPYVAYNEVSTKEERETKREGRFSCVEGSGKTS